jgi:hypothetical protein
MRHATPFLSVLCLGLVAACGGGGPGGPDPLPDPPPFDAADFSGAAIDNPFFPLVPGTTSTWEGDTDEGHETIVEEVTAVLRVILGVSCVEVHAQAFVDGELVEDTLDWYAQDDFGNVWYLGEYTEEIENGQVVSTAGSWEAGVGGALPGVIMWANPMLGQVYRQEYHEGEAEDTAEVVGLGEQVVIGIGPFAGCLHTEEWTPLEPGLVEDKFYAPGTGLVLEVSADGFRIELVSVVGP